MRAYLSAFVTAVLVTALLAAPSGGSEDRGRIATSGFVHLPLMFEANVGQLPETASFISRGPGYTVSLGAKEIELRLQARRTREDSQSAAAVIKVGIEGAGPRSKPQGVDELRSKTNYFIGSNSSNWFTGVRTFGKIKYENVYPGIDLLFYGTGRELEYDLLIHPEADPGSIEFSIEGKNAVKIERDGAVAITTPVGAIRFRAPLIYQELAQGRQIIDGHFQLATAANGKKNLSFEVGHYDHSRTLVIDPVLDYSSYLGGGANDWASGIVADRAGNAYLVGTTASLDFAVTANAAFPAHGACNLTCYDAFVAKVSTSGNSLEYATYLGGGGDDSGIAIAVDPAGNAYVTGITKSNDFPTTANALERNCGGTCFFNDAFVAKLNSTGSALLYSTYLGGSGEDFGSGIAVRNTNAYVTGFSDSIDFPTTAGAFQTAAEGQGSSFVVELNPVGTAETFGTFLGEVDLFDAGGSIAVDTAGNSYVTGTTLSANFPRTSGAFHTPFLSGLSNNLYILKLNTTGTALTYSALLGGVGSGHVAVDTAGNAYVAASAGSFFPVTRGAIDQPCNDGILLMKLNTAGSNLITASHLCPDRMWPVGVTVDSSKHLIFAGLHGFPVSPDDRRFSPAFEN